MGFIKEAAINLTKRYYETYYNLCNIFGNSCGNDDFM